MKATHQEALGFYMFHCFNISEHINVSVLFFIISVSCFAFLCWIFENNCAVDGVLAQFSYPRGCGFALSLCLERFILPFKKFPWGLPRGEGNGQAWN